MPVGTVDGVDIEFAEEGEVLAFANKLREAGDADPIGALMPSTPGNSQACLIANALNFQSQVTLLYESFPSYGVNNGGDEGSWIMAFPENMDEDRIREIAEAVGCETITVWKAGNSAAYINKPKGDGHFLLDPYERRLVIKLPRLIGNAAHAFDRKLGWTTKYNKFEIEAKQIGDNNA